MLFVDVGMLDDFHQGQNMRREVEVAADDPPRMSTDLRHVTDGDGGGVLAMVISGGVILSSSRYSSCLASIFSEIASNTNSLPDTASSSVDAS